MKKEKFLITRKYFFLVKTNLRKRTVNKMDFWVKFEIRIIIIIGKTQMPQAAELVVRLKREKNLKNSVLITTTDMMMKKVNTK